MHVNDIGIVVYSVYYVCVYLLRNICWLQFGMMQIAAIVTQPPSGRDRGRKVMPSPVAQHALDRGFPSDLIFTPIKAGEVNYVLQMFCYTFAKTIWNFGFNNHSVFSSN